MGPARRVRARGGLGVTAPSGRALGGVCLGLAVAAGLLWWASAVAWYRLTPPGRPPVTVDGGAAQPSLTAVALLALAGIAAVVATAGLVRRALGGLLVLVGAAVAVLATLALLTPAVTAAPLLAAAGGVLLAAVGVSVLLTEPRLARLGARYAASGTRAAAVDPDRAAWTALDEGRDPTTDPVACARDETDDPGGGRAGGAV